MSQSWGVEAAFMKMTFKYFLKRGAYTNEQFNRLLAETKFGERRVDTRGVALSIYLRKNTAPVLQN